MNIIRYNFNSFKKILLTHYNLIQPKKPVIREWNKELLFITKVPPTIGGVSTQEYWRIRELANRGYKVRVVTNTNEEIGNPRVVNYSISDLELLDYKNPISGGFLKFYYTESYDHTRHKHFPEDKMSQSKLVGLSLYVIDKYKSSVILSGYLEPYGAAASEVSNLTGVPIYQYSAGSDLERLTTSPELAIRYEYIFQNADLVGTSWENFSKFLSLSIPLQKLTLTPPPIMLYEKERKKENRYILKNKSLTIGIFGKLNNYKSLRELSNVIIDLNKNGKNVCLKASFTYNDDIDDETKKLLNFMESKGYLANVSPFKPWEINQFLNDCDLISLLERNFKVSIHTPITFYEAMSAGKLALISEEFFLKLQDREKYSENNYLLIKDNNFSQNLYKAIEKFIDNPPNFTNDNNFDFNLNNSIDDYIRNIEYLGQNVSKINNRNILFENIVIICSYFPYTISYILDKYETFDYLLISDYHSEYSNVIKSGYNRICKIIKRIKDPIASELLKIEYSKIIALKSFKRQISSYSNRRINFSIENTVIRICSKPVILSTNIDLKYLFSSIKDKEIKIKKHKKTFYYLITAQTPLNSKYILIDEDLKDNIERLLQDYPDLTKDYGKSIDFLESHGFLTRDIDMGRK